MTNDPQDFSDAISDTLTPTGSTNQTYVVLRKKLQENADLSVKFIPLVGQMVFFKYHPISKAFLKSRQPYDVFPLVIITKVNRSATHTSSMGFEGINLHYLSLKHRNILFNKLITYIPLIDHQNTLVTRLQIKSKKIAHDDRFYLLAPCYKKYIMEGFKRKPIIIPKEHWETMVNLNTGLFARGIKKTIELASYIHANEERSD